MFSFLQNLGLFCSSQLHRLDACSEVQSIPDFSKLNEPLIAPPTRSLTHNQSVLCAASSGRRVLRRRGVIAFQNFELYFDDVRGDETSDRSE